ncbi:MAG: hypothetical protein LBQ60_05025 [Bacteroidales bacterium]|jgi:hypothetical protein|nr:hypothetical protein [Bacteroidales bacterium]
MKKLIAFIITASVFSVAISQEYSKGDAIINAENVAFALANKVQNENSASLFFTGNGLVYREYYPDPIFKKISAWEPITKRIVLEPKTHVLGVNGNGGKVKGHTVGGVSLQLDTLTFNFESGKYYKVDSRVDNGVITNFTIEETDIITPYVAYQTANPNRLDGAWSGDGKRMMTSFSNKYYFEGSRLKFEGESKNPKQTFVVEGKLMYNENTIIFFPETAIHKGKEVKNFNSRADRAMYIWYYLLTDNELQIEGGNPFLIGTQSWVNTGNFKKNN